MKKISTAAKRGDEIFEEPKLTIAWTWETDQAITAFWMRLVK